MHLEEINGDVSFAGWLVGCVRAFITNSYSLSFFILSFICSIITVIGNSLSAVFLVRSIGSEHTRDLTDSEKEGNRDFQVHK